MYSKEIATVLVLTILSTTSFARLPQDCGSLKASFGPYDYRDPDIVTTRLREVEDAHFNSDVESLKRGMTEAGPGGDIDYMLRAYPNHHRALFSIGRLSKQSGRLQPVGTSYSAECYYLRALEFAPDDGVVRMLYGIYLSYWEKFDKALQYHEEAVQMMPESAEAHYNLGLLLVRIDKLERAAEAAATAYKLGYPLSGLKRQLARRGVRIED